MNKLLLTLLFLVCCCCCYCYATEISFGGLTYYASPNEEMVYARPMGSGSSSTEMRCDVEGQVCFTPKEFICLVSHEDEERQQQHRKWTHDLTAMIGVVRMDRLDVEVAIGNMIYALSMDGSTYYARPRDTPPLRHTGCTRHETERFDMHPFITETETGELVMYECVSPQLFLEIVKGAKLVPSPSPSPLR